MANSKPIRKLLIANRGEIARRVMRTCREMGIETVAVFSDADRFAPFVTEADEAVRIGAASPSASYLRGDAIVDAARRTGTDAIHPGYGFLSEDASFGELCESRGVALVGPPAHVLRAMGSKLEAKRMAVAAGLPVLPSIEVSGRTASDVDGAARELGFPLLVKASAGGGGRGMRLVQSAQELTEAIAAARREAKAGFGDDTVFLEPWLATPRHVEVQILGDAHGRVIHLFERECSIQRRYQKIVEEAPSPAVDEDLRARLGAAAVAIGEAAGYVGAGTVEFLLAPDGRFYFLEVNARLQVEHPVTEALTGLDLVRLQIEVAQGKSLSELVSSVGHAGHAIEVRLYAEDPEAGFVPTTGTVHHFAAPDVPGLRVDSAVEDGTEVSPHYDAMLAKLIVHAPTRIEAARRLARALRLLRVDGVRTNRALLSSIIEHEVFLRGEIDTHFLERHPPAELVRGASDAHVLGSHALAAALWSQARRRDSVKALRAVPSGWRNVASGMQEVAFVADGERVDVAYRLTRGGLEARVQGQELRAAATRVLDGGVVELEVDGLLRRIEVREHAGVLYAQSAHGRFALEEVPRFRVPESADVAGSLRAPMPGTVIRVSVSEGDAVEAGQELVAIEAMKMEHRIPAPHAGRVSAVRVQVGETVSAGTILVVVDASVDKEQSDGG